MTHRTVELYAFMSTAGLVGVYGARVWHLFCTRLNESLDGTPKKKPQSERDAEWEASQW